MTDCVLWQGSVDPNGYGVLPGSFGADRSVRRKYYGIIPEGFTVFQTCGEKLCYNPDHLDIRRRSKKAKTTTPAPKRDTSARDREIYDHYMRGGTTHRLTARRFGVSEWVVDKAIKRVEGK